MEMNYMAVISLCLLTLKWAHAGNGPGSVFSQGVLMKPADFGKPYNGTVSYNSSISIYHFIYNETKDQTTAIRMSTSSTGSDADYPAIFVVRQESSVMSWQIPLLLDYTYEYYSVSRTLCPRPVTAIQPIQNTQRFSIAISTQSVENVDYSIQANILTDFHISTGEERHLVASPSEPVYVMYTFPKGVSTVIVRALSQDMTCMTLSVQNIKCPVFDLDKDVDYQGTYQTMTKQGAITVDRNSVDNSKAFYIVVVMKPNDDACSGDNKMKTIHEIGANTLTKNVTLKVEKTIPSSQYYKATLASVGFFLAFYVTALFLGIFYHGCKKNWGVVDIIQFDRSMSAVEDETQVKRPLTETAENRTYGTITSDSIDSSEPASSAQHIMAYPGNTDDVSVDSLKSDDFDFLADANSEKNIVRTKTHLYVSDLARKNEKRQGKNYKIYWKNLFTISIFYGLPVIQLVLTYQKVLNLTGDQDICYYNFACAHPLGHVSSFNNIFSNSGYILLGILFLILVARRDFLHRIAQERSEGREKLFGIPQHFGLFYAMGLALCMEGVMSGCYHVCPTVSNFQFDTSFMYIMACLCILKIYQNRHPDISAKAHSSYLLMAVIIIVAVIGVVYGTNVFWIVFALVYMMASLVLSIHIYYMGRWQLDRYVFKRLWLLFRTDWMKCSRPMYINRLILLVLGNIINCTIAVYGVVSSQENFATYLLAIFICNLSLYTVFYVMAKLFAREKIAKLTLLFIVLAGISWGFALHFFFAHLTSWQLSPAISREGNRECILLDFYDSHDVWHFLSAISLFFSFLVLLTLDDEIIYTRRDRIPVF